MSIQSLGTDDTFAHFHHPLEGTPYHLCKKHHPEVANGVARIDDILAQYKKYRDSQAAGQSAHRPQLKRPSQRSPPRKSERTAFK